MCINVNIEYEDYFFKVIFHSVVEHLNLIKASLCIWYELSYTHVKHCFILLNILQHLGSKVKISKHLKQRNIRMQSKHFLGGERNQFLILHYSDKNNSRIS